MEEGDPFEKPAQIWRMDTPCIAKTDGQVALSPGHKRSTDRPKKSSLEHRDTDIVPSNVQIHHVYHQQLSPHRPQRKRSDEVDRKGPKTPRRKPKDTCPLDFYGDDAMLPVGDRRDTGERAASVEVIHSSRRASGNNAHRHDSVMQARKAPRQRDTEYQQWISQSSPNKSSPREAAAYYGVSSNPHLDEKDELRLASEPPSSPMSVRNDDLTDPLTQSMTQSSETTTTTTSTQRSPNIARIENRNRLERYLREQGPHPTLASVEQPYRPTPPPPPPPLLLPLPDFIAPTPAVKQRYVSAGGDAKLKDRPEIEPPPWALTPAKLDTSDLPPQMALLSPVSAGPIPTRELTFFPAFDVSHPTLERLSSESGDHTNTTPPVRGEKRGRTASATSMRDKIKRVFSSRKSSDAEDRLQGSFSS